VLVAAAVMVSGCGADDGEVTTTSPPPEAPVNPWDLPLEERPDLFDPCAEIPVEAVEEALGGPVEPDEQLRIERPGELLSCGWRNRDVIFTVLATWKSRDEYLNDRMFVADEHTVAGRPGLRLTDKSQARSCRLAIFTSSGTVYSSIDLIHALSAFRGDNFADPCEVLDAVLPQTLRSLPEGDY